MHPVVAFYFIPARDAFDGDRFSLVDIKQYLAIHVLGHGQAEKVQKRGTDIEEYNSFDRGRVIHA